MTDAYQLEGVSYRHGDTRALTGVTLNIEAGSVTALTGPNGAGKSTLLHVLAFLEPPATGTVRFFGQPAPPDALTALRRRVGLVPQNPYLLKGTVADNVALGLSIRRVAPDRRRARVNDALARLGLTALADRPVGALSGGEAQRVAIARTLVLEPEVLLLDEPFTHLDADCLAETERLVADLCGGGRTAVLTSHDRARAQAVADRVVGLVGGKLAPASLLNLFTGRIDRAAGVFDTGRIRVVLPDGCPDGRHLAVEANHIVVSAAPLDSSMRNAFPGRIVGLAEAGGPVRVTVDGGERFEAEVTAESVALQGLRPGLSVWVSFKSTALTVF